MFNDTVIVQTAISAFNNAALAMPAFLWFGILCLPLLFGVYKLGNVCLDALNIEVLKNPKTKLLGFSFVIMAMMFVWLALSGGNYDVLRDSKSVLPFVMAGLLFITSASAVQKLKTINPVWPEWIQKHVKYKSLLKFGLLLAVSAFVAVLSGLGLYLSLLQFAGVFCGALVGRAFKKGFNPIFMTTVVVFAVASVILMQPEFFRFGQMGNLTLVHKLAFIVIAGLVAFIFAVRNIKPKAKVHHSAYIKIKWLCRFSSALAAAIFLFTESIPVFFGMTAMFFISVALSVWHAEKLPAEALSKKVWAWLLMCFGILTINPVISVLAVLLAKDIQNIDMKKYLKQLL